MNKDDINDRIFNEIFSVENVPRISYQYMYRYEFEKYYSEIIGNKCYIRFSNVNNFNDKTEGKIIFNYYKKAINILKKKNIINDNQFDYLINIQPNNKHEFRYEEDSQNYGKIISYPQKECEVLAFCMSYDANNEHFIKQGRNTTIGFRYFDDNNLRKYKLNEFDFKIANILYGEEAIEYIEKQITGKISRLEGSDIETTRSFLEGMIYDLQYFVKKDIKKYKDEKEVRILLFVDKDRMNLSHYYKYELEGNYLKYLTIEMDKIHFLGRN